MLPPMGSSILRPRVVPVAPARPSNGKPRPVPATMSIPAPTSLMLEAGLLVEVEEQSPQPKKGDDK
jgi:hypothetical protein